MLYMSSQMGNDGSYSLSVTFEVGVNLNTALVMVQNRVTLAMPLFPSQVQSQGITIRKKNPDMLCMVNFVSAIGIATTSGVVTGLFKEEDRDTITLMESAAPGGEKQDKEIRIAKKDITAIDLNLTSGEVVTGGFSGRRRRHDHDLPDQGSDSPHRQDGDQVVWAANLQRYFHEQLRPDQRQGRPASVGRRFRYQHHGPARL